jgi:DNA primase
VRPMSPGEGVEWQSVLETASRLHDLLGNERLNSWPKTTGGKGLHIMVPIEAKLAWNAARDYTREIAERLAATGPGKYTTSAAFSASFASTAAIAGYLWVQSSPVRVSNRPALRSSRACTR